MRTQQHHRPVQQVCILFVRCFQATDEIPKCFDMSRLNGCQLRQRFRILTMV
jgi:hypothetical protein